MIPNWSFADKEGWGRDVKGRRKIQKKEPVGKEYWLAGRGSKVRNCSRADGEVRKGSGGHGPQKKK